MSKNKMIGSCLRYPGGKQRLVKDIAKYIPRDFYEYREPFFGGGSLFFYVRNLKLGHYFWLNDLFEPVANFWLHMAPTYEMLSKSNKKSITVLVEELVKKYPGRELFDYIKLNYEKATKQEQAAMFFCLNRITFSGLTFSGGYSKSAHEGRLKQSHIDLLAKSSSYTWGCKVTNEDYSVLLSASPTIEEQKEVFIYLDPPYDIKSDNLYGNHGNQHKGFDHKQFAEDCKKCEHKWLITYNESEYIRSLFDGWTRIVEIPVTYNMNSKNKKKTELLIMNY